jgi:hypothetical protein
MVNKPTSDASGDTVFLTTRVLAALIVPILVAAFVMLYLFPGDTAQLFAWPVKPPMSALMLGGTYLGGAYFFTIAATTRRWHYVSLGFLPVTAFAGILGVATALHWDRFTHGHVSFELWAFLYFTLPFVIPFVWYRNARAEGGARQGPGRRLPRELMLTVGGLGGVLVAASIVLLFFPEVMIPTWPWALTPLTARVLSAMFALSGLVGLGIAVDGRWSAARVPFQAQVISIVLILLGLVIARDDVTWSRWETWLFVAGLVLELGVIGWAAVWSRSSRVTDPSDATP